MDLLYTAAFCCPCGRLRGPAGSDLAFVGGSGNIFGKSSSQVHLFFPKCLLLISAGDQLLG